MLPFTVYGSGDTTLVLMPFLGGSQLEWRESVKSLGKKFRCITVDLPGFGEAAAIPGYSVSEMADSLVELLISLKLDRYVLVGHSMAGKISAVVARRLIDDPAKAAAPFALVLVAPSPPGPEPMSDSKRKGMLESLGTVTADDRNHAQKFIKDNLTRPVPKDIFDRTVDEVLRMNRAAWIAWLESGSKEDWSRQVGVLDIPTLILAASDDGALGPAVQSRVTEPHFSRAHLITVDCNHLIPIEQPDEAAALISNFMQVLH